MLARIIFFTSIFVAILTVVLLALFSPVNHNRKPGKSPNRPWLALSLYIQQPQLATTTASGPLPVARSGDGALVFHRKLTEGPESTSWVVGKAQGFIIPVEHFAHSAFNLIYLTFDTHKYTGSLSVEAKHFAREDGGKLAVVGGTGSFAFARGLAVLSQTSREYGTYRIELHLKFPNRSQTIPG
ncbi:dirigent protein 25 [Diospyros lotus]|uniref:dirigent protein 25 n=1 Tax=Diospyros lotus TaxID=55363 RepID=UPI002255B860|nr:dirigent protein 25 [Diospyros lotus]